MIYLLEHPLQASTGIQKYRCVIEWRGGTLITDEPVKNGGGDAGPDPSTLLLSSVATCTLATLRMYIDRKGWDVPFIKLSTNFYRTIAADGKITTTIEREADFAGAVLTPEQVSRLLDIAGKCPVSRMLEGEIKTVIKMKAG